MNESEELTAAAQSADMLAESIRRMFRARLDMTMPPEGHGMPHRAAVAMLSRLLGESRAVAIGLHALAD